MRGVAAVIAGYAVVAALVWILFTILYLLLGTEGAFKARSFEPSALWVTTSFVLGFVAAIVGGIVCAIVSRGGKAVTVLAVLVFLFRVLSAGFAMMETPEKTVREGELGVFEAMSEARSPTWVNWLNAVVGPIGILVGARLQTGKAADVT